MNLCAPKGGELVFNHGIKYTWVLRLPYGAIQRERGKPISDIIKQYTIMAKNRISKNRHNRNCSSRYKRVSNGDDNG